MFFNRYKKKRQQAYQEYFKSLQADSKRNQEEVRKQSEINYWLNKSKNSKDTKEIKQISSKLLQLLK